MRGAAVVATFILSNTSVVLHDVLAIDVVIVCLALSKPREELELFV